MLPKKIAKQPTVTMSSKNIKFSRYLLFRYSLVLFFFTNIYWMMGLLLERNFLIAVPILLNILFFMASLEQFELYSLKHPVFQKTKRAFAIQQIVSFLLVVVCISPLFKRVFPLLSDSVISRGVALMTVLVGILLIHVNLNKIVKITQNKDAFYLKCIKN